MWLHIGAGILAEEMGLGKTVEVLALVAANRFQGTYQVPPRRPPPAHAAVPKSYRDLVCECRACGCASGHDLLFDPIVIPDEEADQDVRLSQPFSSLLAKA